MVSARVMQMLGEKIDEKNTFEPPKEPVNKGKTPAFADVNPIWLRIVNDVRTRFIQANKYVYIPDLNYMM